MQADEALCGGYKEEGQQENMRIFTQHSMGLFNAAAFKLSVAQQCLKLSMACIQHAHYGTELLGRAWRRV